MAKILIALMTLFGSLAVVAPASAQTSETYEDIVADPTLTAEHAIVVRFYQAVFARQPDPGGLRFWLDSFDSGEWSTRRIANFFATSDEFLDLYGETDNVAFMTAVYSNVLGRQPDAAGGKFWTDQLDAGMSRAEMILLISNAPEFVDKNLIAADNQAEDELRFDYGMIERVEIVAGVTWIWFDRWTFGAGLDANGNTIIQQGVELTEEPRWELASDWHGRGNANPRLRRYPLASDASVLELDPDDIVEVCGGNFTHPYEFVETDAATLARHNGLSSLTFNTDGAVTLVRDQRAC